MNKMKNNFENWKEKSKIKQIIQRQKLAEKN